MDKNKKTEICGALQTQKMYTEACKTWMEDHFQKEIQTVDSEKNQLHSLPSPYTEDKKKRKEEVFCV